MFGILDAVVNFVPCTFAGGLCNVCLLLKLLVFTADVVGVDLYNAYVFVYFLWFIVACVLLLGCERVVCVGIVLQYDT